MFYAIEVLRKHKFDTDCRISACIVHYIYAYAIYNIELIHLPFTVCGYEGGGLSDTANGRKESLKAQYKALKRCYGWKHYYYMIKMTLSGQLLKQKLSTIPVIHNMYEAVAKAVYSWR